MTFPSMEQILAKDELRFIWLSLAETMDLWFNWRQGYMFIQVSVSTMNIIQLLTGYEDNSSFVWPKNGSVARSCRLRAIDPFEGQTKLLLFEKPVYNCFVIHLHFFKIFLFTLFTHISIRCFQYPRPSRPRIWMMPWIC